MRTPALIILIFLSVPKAGTAQTDSTVSKNIFRKLESYSKNHVIEKAYLHFDKPYYAAGDTMYFKAYVTLGSSHRLSAHSGVLHAELIDNRTGKVMRTENLEIINGVAWGDFTLPDTLAKGNYPVRAYTRWMLNEGHADFFEQNIAVGAVRAHKVVSTAASPAAIKPDLQFFPEGGSLVTGVRSKVAFKAIGGNGLGMAVKGEVLDNENKQIIAFASVHLGMGYFYFTPHEGKAYRAKLIYANGAQDEIGLPKADDNSIVLSVNNDSSQNAPVAITAGSACYRNNKNKYYTLVIYSGSKLTNLIFKLDTPAISGNLLKSRLHSGITRLTLFSPAGEPLSERLIFIKNDDLLKLNLSSDKTSYAKREKVTINLNALKHDGIPATGDFSVSVTDESKVPVDENTESTILNNLLLTSDLKGFVEEPNSYFCSTRPEAAENLDILMLTQGYSHFEWKAILDDKAPAIRYQPEQFLSLSGTVKTAGGKPSPKTEISLGLIKQLLAMDTVTDANGNFTFDDLDIADTAKLLLRAKGNKTIEIKQPEYAPVIKLSNYGAGTSIPMIKPQIAAEMRKRYEQSGNMKTGITLKQVDIKGAKHHPWEQPLTHSSNLNGPGQANQVIMGDKLLGCDNLADCLRDFVISGVKFIGLTIYSKRTHMELNGNTKPMAVIVDGIIYDQKSDILSRISYSDVYSIELLESPGFLSIYGSAATGGAIVITTRRGDERSSVTMQPGLTTYVFNGFYKAREFYSPKYEAAAPLNGKPDQRTTIAWKPVLLTDKEGNASFDFYNADGIGTYRIVVEGIDSEGNIGRQVYRYKVE